MPWDYRNIENNSAPPCPQCHSVYSVQCVWKPLYRCLRCGYSFEATYREEPEERPARGRRCRR
jgi:tRNA(Ile2) C34 agmatinyltransferase TiaS